MKKNSIATQPMGNSGAEYFGGGLDFEIVVVSAVRYALGRRTYVVSSVVDYVLHNIGSLSLKTVGVIARDIRECSDLGHQCDIDKWNELLVACEAKLELLK